MVTMQSSFKLLRRNVQHQADGQELPMDNELLLALHDEGGLVLSSPCCAAYHHRPDKVIGVHNHDSRHLQKVGQ